MLLREEMACPSWVCLFLILPEHLCPCHWCLWLFHWGFCEAAFERFILWKALYKSIWSELNVSLHHTLLWLCSAATRFNFNIWSLLKKKKGSRSQVIFCAYIPHFTRHTFINYYRDKGGAQKEQQVTVISTAWIIVTH